MRKRKIFILFLSMLFISGFFVYKPMQTKAITQFEVFVSPQYIGDVAYFYFFYTVEAELPVHAWIELKFPPGTSFNPPIPTEETAKKERLRDIADNIKFFSCEIMGLPIINYLPDGSVTILFRDNTNKREIGDKIKLYINKGAGIANPTTPGSYRYALRTENEPDFYESQPVMIYGETLSPATVKLTNPVAGETTGIEIEFTLGEADLLHFWEDSFIIEFPKTFIFYMMLMDMDKNMNNMIFINDVPLIYQTFLLDSDTSETTGLVLPVLKSTKPYEKIKITIDQRFGIRNPFKPGEYTVGVWTTALRKTVDSKPFHITPSSDEACVTLSYNTANVATDVDIVYNTTENLEVKDEIQVVFPKEFEIETEKIACHFYSPNRVPIHVEVFENVITIPSPINIQNGETIRLLFTYTDKILTPAIAGSYSFLIKHKKTNKVYKSNSLMIRDQILEIIDVQPTVPNAYTITSYSFLIIFHPDKLPKYGDTLVFYFSFLDHPVEFQFKRTIERYETITLHDIQNPEPGNYSVSVQFGNEKAVYPVKINIIPPLPQTTIRFEGGKEGNNSWFIEIPNITFLFDDPDSITEYKVEGKETIIEKRGSDKSDPLPPGQYVALITYYSFSAYGFEDPKEFILKVDTVPPQVNIRYPTEKKSVQNTNTIFVKGKITPVKMDHYNGRQLVFDKNLTINGIETEVRGDGFFSKELSLLEGNNTIQIKAVDEAGNAVQYDYEVFVDTKAPTLIVESPFEGEIVISKRLEIKGKTEPGALFFINGEAIPINNDGSFLKEIHYDALGKKTIELVAQDQAENKTRQSINFWFGITIQLKIGNKQASINNRIVTLTSPPMIQQGRTMVPIRAITEGLGAKVVWDAKTRKVTIKLGTNTVEIWIGKKEGKVNGKTVILDVPPQIFQGVTMVPLRFIAENLDCIVQWDASTQTITIQYPKL